MSSLLDTAQNLPSLLPQQIHKASFITAATIITTYAFYKTWFFGPKDSCPIVPYTNPLYGSTAEYRSNPQAFAKKWTEKLGLVYRVHLFGRIQTIVAGKYVQEIFKNDHFSGFEASKKRFHVALLTGTSNEKSNVRYNLLLTIFRSYLIRRLKEFTPRIANSISIGLNEALKSSTENSIEMPHLYPLAVGIVARACASVFVGERLSRDPNILEIFQNVASDIASVSPRVYSTWLDPFQKLITLRMWAVGKFSSTSSIYRRRLTQALVPEIESRLKNMQDPSWERPDDLLQGLIEYGDFPPEELDIPKVIVGRVLRLIFPSVVPTARTLAITLYRLLSRPEYMDEIIQEQEEIFSRFSNSPSGDHLELFDLDILKQMTKLDSLCRESLRCSDDYFNLPKTNSSNHPIVLSNGTTIDPDGDVLINFYYNHKSNELSERSSNGDRDEFKPFRHVTTGKKATVIGEDSYIAFGMGRHACPGRFFAIYIIKATISMIIHNYDVRPSSNLIFPTSFGNFIPSGKVMFTNRHHAA